jgi:antitoxin component YwqK of YwqJK toxin-antitoxin module
MDNTLNYDLHAYFLITISIISFTCSFGQQPRYHFKSFVKEQDSIEFKVIRPIKDGLTRTYIRSHPEYFDLDDDSSTYIRGSQDALICFEGNKKNGKREGIFSAYLIDSFDHSKRYRIWEQTFVHDRLNGQWRTYTLKGGLVNFQTFKDDSLIGIARNFWIDGRTVISEVEYFKSHDNFANREFYQNGNIEKESNFENGKQNGKARRFYEDGTLQEEANFKNGELDQTRKYYYPTGQVWFERTYKEGKCWKVVSNYTITGQKRDPGTLNDGNGTVIFYNDDGTIRQVINYVDGRESQ